MMLILKIALGVMIGQVIGGIVTSGINRLGSFKSFKLKESIDNPISDGSAALLTMKYTVTHYYFSVLWNMPGKWTKHFYLFSRHDKKIRELR